MKNSEEESSSVSPDPGSYGVERIEVVLDNADGVFMGGQSIAGTVVLQLAKPIEVLGLRIRCKGEARVHFTDRSVGIRRKFAAEESYVHLQSYLFGDGETKSQLDSGAYPFSLELPEKIPCSFEGLYGRIRYSLRASLVVAEDVLLSSSILPFTLASLFDLNRDSLAPLPISENQSKSFIGQKEPLRMELALPVRGFVPGQSVPMEVTLKNESNVRVAKIRIVLKKVVTYHASDKSRRHKEIVVEIELPVSRACKSEEHFREEFDVPSIPPSGMAHCSIIDVRYALKVEACVDLGEWYYRMLQKNLKIRTSIIVGTVPLKNYEDVVERKAASPTDNGFDTLIPSDEQYERSQIYRSSKPDKDDPTGDEGDSDGEVSPYSPKYRVYKFNKSTKK
ncbi:hypothetical protein TSAR_006832 [Trichomalopsis sarcophagae]|uniref:Arrestin C-terminal-like domain-containing protein n=1 Tax=Trichomalopsis sarcophagae TaxID=543379 RepID=A0A232EIT2_9HYME|nr:hypothetical protein TSAR_006832 [Trichomalopsis sarcophagae]